MKEGTSVIDGTNSVIWPLTDIIVRHGKDRDLGDRTISSFYTTSSLVDSRQIGIHITRVTSSTWYLFSGSRDFSERIGIRRHICKNDENVLLELVGVVFGGCKSQTGCNDTLDPVRMVSFTAFASKVCEDSRRIVGQVEEEGDSV